MTGEPIEVMVKRYRCPFCPRSLSSKTRMVEHIGKCWRNPAVRGCKTCKHFEPAGYEWSESCDDGVDLTVRPCKQCDGKEWSFDTCSECGGSGKDPSAAPAPIVGCDQWEAIDA